MADKFIYLQGKTKWFRHQTPNKFHRYSHQLYLNEESLRKFKELQENKEDVQGIKNVLMKDEDGYYTTLSRPASKEIKGKVIGFAPPMVYMSDGVTPLSGLNIGNGSDITTKMEVYTYFIPGQTNKKGMACRWLSSRIDNLVPYEGLATTLPPDEARAQKGLASQPIQKEDYGF